MDISMDAVTFFESNFSMGLFYGRQKKKEFKAIRELAEENQLNLKQADKVLDIGYHSSLEFHCLREYHPKSQIVGIDITPKKNKRIAREFKEVATLSIMTGDINNLDFEKEYFTAIYCLRTLNLVSDLATFLKQCFFILKKDGYLILSLDHTDMLTPSYLEKYQKNQINTTVYSVSKIVSGVKAMGFQNHFTKSLEKQSEILIACKKN